MKKTIREDLEDNKGAWEDVTKIEELKAELVHLTYFKDKQVEDARIILDDYRKLEESLARVKEENCSLQRSNDVYFRAKEGYRQKLYRLKGISVEEIAKSISHIKYDCTDCDLCMDGRNKIATAIKKLIGGSYART